MKSLYSPWRAHYLKASVDEHKAQNNKGCECIFCEMIEHKELDRQNYIIHRGEHCIGLMNLFPYSSYHMLFLPYAHVKSPLMLDKEAWSELNMLGLKALKLLASINLFDANYGYNIGEYSGAGLPGHLHLHVLPRFRSDTSFLTTLADTRSYGLDFDEIYEEVLSLSHIFKEEL